MTTRVGFRVGTASLRIEARGPVSPERLVGLFPDDVVDPSGGPPDLLLTPSPTGGWRIRADGGDLYPETLAEAIDTLELLVAERLIRGDPAADPFHAGGVDVGGGALLFAGPSGCGKSSLTAALALRGHRVFGDDAVLVSRADGRVRPFRRPLKLHSGALLALGLPGDATGAPRHVHPRDLASDWADPLPLRWCLFPRRSSSSETGLLALPPSHGVRTLLEHGLMEPSTAPERFASVTRAAESTLFYALDFADAARAADRIKEALTPAFPTPARAGN